MSHYSPLYPEMFVDDTVTVAPITSWIGYASIDSNSVILSPEIISGVETTFQNHFNRLNQEIDNFNAALKDVKTNGILDDSVMAIEKIMGALSSTVIEFKGALYRLLRNNIDVAEKASSENQQASQSNSVAARVLSQINFD